MVIEHGGRVDRWTRMVGYVSILVIMLPFLVFSLYSLITDTHEDAPTLEALQMQIDQIKQQTEVSK